MGENTGKVAQNDRIKITLYVGGDTAGSIEAERRVEQCACKLLWGAGEKRRFSREHRMEEGGQRTRKGKGEEKRSGGTNKP